MTLTVQQAYYAVFNAFDTIYDRDKNDSLGCLLSSMSPNIFVGCTSADPAVWLDWENCVKSITKADILTPEQAHQSIISFLELYVSEFGYELTWLIEELQEPSKKKEWLRFASKASTN
jgi:hypothetical protein